jgi:type IV secretion system protein VirB5
MRKHLIALFMAGFAWLAPLHDAKAGIPVIDVTAIANLMQQLSAWQQQLQGMQRQYDQLRQSRDQLHQTYNAMTGSRGMEQMLQMSELARNYLPPSYGELLRTVNGAAGSYAGLSGQVQSIMRANSILSSTQLDALSPELRQVVEQGRQASALFNGMTQTAYQNTSQRFSALQQLIGRISTAQDPKSIQDLQARIQAEQAMLTNEQTKLQNLYQIAKADELTQQQRLREQVISGHGGFGNRFAPAP